MTRFEPSVGKYVYLEVQGVEYRVYFEESGSTGIPLVCQHTAGADGSQWRHLMTDEDITSRFRVIAPDLPYHGKSLPPESVEWWKQEYKLTKSFKIDFHLALIRALDLDRPVFIGSSMGGQLAPDLALACPDEYRAVIGLEASLKTHVGDMRYYRHPRVNGSDAAGVMAYNLCGPGSPERYKREIAWGYSQGGPGVFTGDINYYETEHDLRDTAHLIDTSRCSVYIMNGEYDAATGIKEGLELTARIKGARFIPLYGLGHFPATEDFQSLKKSLMPVLEEIAARK
ncbi:MAG: alpha/beta hydrolase [Dehalococcoidia bacterium]|nr:alpha/beta hydrolase [Dehalococcoidia bacterium]